MNAAMLSLWGNEITKISSINENSIQTKVIISRLDRPLLPWNEHTLENIGAIQVLGWELSCTVGVDWGGGVAWAFGVGCVCALMDVLSFRFLFVAVVSVFFHFFKCLDVSSYCTYFLWIDCTFVVRTAPSLALALEVLPICKVWSFIK